MNEALQSTEFKDEQREAAERCIRMLARLRQVDDRMSIKAAIGLLCIARMDKPSVTDIKDIGEFEMSSASRYARVLGDKGRLGKQGMGLVRRRRHPTNDRKLQLELTEAGKELIDELAGLLEGRRPAMGLEF